MDFDYSIKAIPTKYRGRQYRSRLEAKWAAFFDLLEWRFEYEPGDLGLWSPDFLLFGTYSFRSVLVEVKPVCAFPQPTADKILKSRHKDDSGVSLIVGISPFLPATKAPGLASPVWRDRGAEIGWHSLGETCGSPSWEMTYISPKEDRGGFDLYPDGFPDGFLGGQALGPYGDETASAIRRLWAEATNRVQWHPRDRS